MDRERPTQSESIIIKLPSGQEHWNKPEPVSKTELRAKFENQRDTIKDLAGRLQELGITTEKGIRKWLTQRGVANIGVLPVLDVAVNRIRAKMVPEDQKKNIDKESQELREKFLKKANNKDPQKDKIDLRLLGEYVEADLGMASVLDDLDRISRPDGSSLYKDSELPLIYDRKTHIGSSISSQSILEKLWRHAFDTSNDPHGNNWIKVSGVDDADLMIAVIQAASGQNPQAVREYWEIKLGRLPGKGKTWNDDMRNRVEQEVRGLQVLLRYLQEVARGLLPDKRNPSLRSPEEIQAVLDDMASSFPYTEPVEIEPNQKLKHAHRKVKYKTKSGRTVIGTGGKFQDGSTLYQGYAVSKHWAAKTAESSESKRGFIFKYVPQRRLFAFIASEGFGNVPPTVAGTGEAEVNGKRVELNMAISEYIEGLARIHSENDCAPGQLALAQVTLYEMYDLDWGEGDISNPHDVGNLGYDPETGIAYYIDPDITLDAEGVELATGQVVGIPLIKDPRHPLTRWPQYGVRLPEYAIEKYRKMTDDVLQRKAEQLDRILQDTDAPPEEKELWSRRVEAWFNRRWLVRELIKLTKFDCLPKIYNEDGTIWDYLYDPRLNMFSPGQAELDFIVRMYNSQKPLREAKKVAA